MRVNTNVSSLVAIEASNNNSNRVSSSLEKLSSGFSINKASDNASGLAISDKLRTQASGFAQSANNINSGIAMIQIADKAMGEQSNILDIIKTKLIQAGTATTSDDGVKAIAKDINKLLNQLNNIAQQTSYNGTTLLQESETSVNAKGVLSFQVGLYDTSLLSTDGNVQANTNGLAQGSTTLTLNDLKTDTSGSNPLLSKTDIPTYLGVIDLALTDLNNIRSNYGSTQKQLESSLRTVMTEYTNTLAAESVIRDVDYASESANFAKENILSQAVSYAQSQANGSADGVLRLLQ